MNCSIPIFLAYITIAYSMASCMYLKRTRSMGTEFRDSLNENQLKIKKKVAKIRGDIFRSSMLISLGILLVLKPFKNCM